MQRGPASCKDTQEGLYSLVMTVRAVITNNRRVQCCFHSINHLVFVRCKACLNHEGTHTCIPAAFLCYLQVLSERGTVQRHFLRCTLPDSSCPWLREPKLSLFTTFMNASSMNRWIDLLMPRSLFPHISNRYTKWKVQDRERGAEGGGLRWWQECWEKSEKERNRSWLAAQHHAILWLSNVRIGSCLWIPRVSKIMLSNIVISEKYYFYQTYICIISSWVPGCLKEGIGQILHDWSDWLHFIKGNYCTSEKSRAGAAYRKIHSRKP